MKFIDALRKHQKQHKGMKLPKWEDCKKATSKEVQAFLDQLTKP